MFRKLWNWAYAPIHRWLLIRTYRRHRACIKDWEQIWWARDLAAEIKSERRRAAGRTRSA